MRLTTKNTYKNIHRFPTANTDAGSYCSRIMSAMLITWQNSKTVTITAGNHEFRRNFTF